MKNDTNNMDEFFKNRLNNFDDSDSGWDMPSERPWENARKTFPEYPQKRPFNRNILAFILLGLALAGAGGFIFYQQKNISALNAQLSKVSSSEQTLKANLVDSQNQLSITQTDFSEKVEELLSENKKVDYEIDQLRKKEAFYLKDTEKKSREIENLETEKRGLTEEIIALKNSLASTQLLLSSCIEKSSEIYSEKAEELPILPSLKASLPIVEKKVVSSSNLPLAKIAKIRTKKRFKKYELGLNISASEYQIPFAYNFAEFNAIEDENIIQILNTGELGLHFAYGLKPNLFLRTGIRVGGGGVERELSSTLHYDKTGEYINNNGALSNDWRLETNSPFGTVENRLQFDVPQGANIENGDLVIADLKNIQALVFLKIPLGVDYYIGRSRLQWWLRSGISWNAAFLGDFLVSGNLNLNDDEISLEASEILNQQVTGSSFFSGYAGIGFNYRLWKRWYFRAGYSKEFNIATTSTLRTGSSFDFNNEATEFGFHFRF